MINRKQYYPPRITVEKFIPNEYVASCVEGFRVRCLVGETNDGIDSVPQYLITNNGPGYFSTTDTNGKRDNDHAANAGCGSADNQILTRSGSNWTFKESGGNVLTADDAVITNPYAGMDLSWTTSITNNYGTRYYHHKGKVVDFVSSNHS